MDHESGAVDQPVIGQATQSRFAWLMKPARNFLLWAFFYLSTAAFGISVFLGDDTWATRWLAYMGFFLAAIAWLRTEDRRT